MSLLRREVIGILDGGLEGGGGDRLIRFARNAVAWSSFA